MTDNDETWSEKVTKRLLDAFTLGYTEGRQGKPEIPTPQDDASAALAREEIPSSAGTVEIRAWGRNNAVTVHRGL